MQCWDASNNSELDRFPDQAGKSRISSAVAILNQALDHPVVFNAPGFDEGVERRERILLTLRHPDLGVWSESNWFFAFR
jgi:hypothetical protein